MRLCACVEAVCDATSGAARGGRLRGHGESSEVRITRHALRRCWGLRRRCKGAAPEISESRRAPTSRLPESRHSRRSPYTSDRWWVGTHFAGRLASRGRAPRSSAEWRRREPRAEARAPEPEPAAAHALCLYSRVCAGVMGSSGRFSNWLGRSGRRRATVPHYEIPYSTNFLCVYVLHHPPLTAARSSVRELAENWNTAEAGRRSAPRRSWRPTPWVGRLWRLTARFRGRFS